MSNLKTQRYESQTSAKWHEARGVQGVTLSQECGGPAECAGRPQGQSLDPEVASCSRLLILR